jgi:hypothetical protein
MIGRALVVVAVLTAAAAARADIPIGGACKGDRECVLGSICEKAVCTALPKRVAIFPFYYHGEGVVGHTHIPILAYFSTWYRTEKTQVQFPFFVRTTTEHATTTVVPPLFFFKRHSTEHDTYGVVPFFFYQTNHQGKPSVVSLLPLFWRSQGKSYRLTLLPWLLFGTSYDRETDTGRTALFPLFFDYKHGDRRDTVAPFSYFQRRGPRRLGAIFPIVFFQSNRAEGTSETVVLPLFEYARERHGRYVRFSSLLGGYERDDDQHSRTLALVTPPFFHRRDLKRDVDVAPPFFARWKVHDDGSTGIAVGPYLHTSDPEGTSDAFIPLYLGLHDRKTGASTHILFPIAGFHKHKGAAGGFVGPVYGWRGDAGWGFGVAPVLFFGRDNVGQHHELVLPIFARWGDRQSTNVLVGPFFHHRDAHGFSTGIAPLFFAGRSDDTRWAVVPPLLFVHRSNRDSITDVVGPVYAYKGKRGWAGGLAPLIAVGRLDGVSHQVILPPLFIHFSDERHDTLLAGGLFYHHRDGDERTDVLFPLLYLNRGPGHGLALTPLGGWRKDGPVSTVVVGPYVYRKNDRTHSRYHFFFPLGLGYDRPGYSVRVQFPFFWRVSEGRDTDTHLFPLVWWGKSGDKRRVLAIWPLVSVFVRTEVAATAVVGPLWLRKRADGGVTAGLFPLVAYGKSIKGGKSSSWFGAPGIYWAKNEHAGNQELVVGPLFDVRRPDGYTSGLIPIAFAWRRGTASKVLTPIFYRQADSASDYALNVLGPLYWGHYAAAKKFGLFPILFVKTGGDGSSSTTLFPLFNYTKKKDGGSIFATALFGWSNYKGGTRGWAGPVYWRRDLAQSSTAVWPIFYHGVDKVTGARNSLFLPLFYDGRASDGRELQEYSPLIWRYHNVESTILVGLPLFFDVHRFGESRTTGFLPFYLRNDNRVIKSTSWVFPPILTFVRHRRTGADPGTDVVLFPIVWRFGGRDSTTVVAPLYWDFKRGESRTTVFFPIAARWIRPDGDYLLVLNMYYRKGLGPREGSWYVNVFPLCSFGRPRPHDLEWSVLEGLFGYSRQGRNRSLRLLWLLEFKLEPVPESNLSWWSNTPPSARTEW